MNPLDNPDMYETVQVFTYTTPSGHTFQWRITDILRYIEKLGIKPNTTVSVADMKMLLENNLATAELDKETINKADLGNPLLIVELPSHVWDNNGGRHLVIDGWHRMSKAVAEGKELAGFLLPLSVSNMFRTR